MSNRPAPLTCSILATAFAASCATYPERTGGALDDFRRGHFQPALEAYADAEWVRSDFLSGAEAGTVALTWGDWEATLFHLHRAADAAREIEKRALLGTEELGETLASWAVNDTARVYEGEGFERVYVHCGLAMAYLAQGLLDDVYVEARLANQLLEAEEKLYDKEYRAGGWGHLLSAVSYEIRGEYGEAYIDYARMEEKDVGRALAGKALIRLARWLGRPEELSRWEGKYGPAPELPDGAANVVVLAGVGLGPFKVETRIPIPTHDGLIPISAASYAHRPQPVSGLVIRASDGSALETVVVESVSEVAEENLKDRLALQLAKSTARGLLKRELTKKMEREWGWQGFWIGNLYAFLSERADLRAWLTLPDTWQAGRLFVPPGVHGFTLEAIGGEIVDLGTYELEPGETMLVYARTLGPRLHAHVIGGQPRDPVEIGRATVGGMR